MKIFYFFFIISVALSAPVAGKAFDTIVTTEADVIFGVRDISELRGAWVDHPLVRDFEEASLPEYFENLFRDADADGSASDFEALLEEFNLDEEQLFELFPDQLSLVLYNLPELLLQKTERPDLAIMANFTGTAERLAELMQIQFERNAKAQKEVNPAIEHEMIEERFMGETLHFDEVFDGEESYIEDGYALVDGIFVLARPEERLRDLVESIKLGSDMPIERNAAYQRAREASGAVDLMLYVNFESVMPVLNEALLKQNTAGGMAMFGVTGQSLEAALALQALQGFSLDAKINDDGIASHSAIIYREKSGFLGLMAYGEGPLPEASFVPEGVISSTVARFDLTEMFARLEALLGVASANTPALINIQLQQIKAKTGVDLRSALLENFGSELVTFSVLPEERQAVEAFAPAQQVYVLRLKDAVALSGALEALKDMVPGGRAQIKTREFQGETIHTLPTAGDPTLPEAAAYEISFVVTRAHLVFSIGRPGLIRGVLTAMQTQDSGFWQLEETARLIDRIGRSGAVARSYTDFGQVVAALVESFAGISQLSGNHVQLAPSTAPSALDLPWHLLTETYEAEDGIFSDMILLRKEGAR